MFVFLLRLILQGGISVVASGAGQATALPFLFPSGADVGDPSTFTLDGTAGTLGTTIERVESVALTDANGSPTATIPISGSYFW